MIRQPIVTVVAHVDHGKTTLLDYIRHTTVAAKEAGAITQNIGTTQVPVETIKKLCGPLLERFNIKIEIPGLLFIDTPGHASFVGMRERGGSIADIAVLLIDINEGVKPQTEESIEILKRTKTPFVVALNKIDKIRGWENRDVCFLNNYPSQTDEVKAIFEEMFYRVVGDLSKYGFDAERFDRIEDFTKKLAIVPISAKTGEGIPELLTILTGLAQQYLKNRLTVGEKCKGLILEVKEVRGLGTTIDTVIHDGSAKKNDYLVIAGNEPIVTKIKALLVPEPLRDIRAERKFKPIDKVEAAMGVKIVAPGLDKAIAGSEFMIVSTEEEAKTIANDMKKELKEIKTEEEGLILKASTIGGLEALVHIFDGYPIKRANIGDITKKDIIDAEANKDEFLRVVVGFDVSATDDAVQMAKDKKIKILDSDVIYRLKEGYEEFRKEKEKEIKEREIEGITRPAKFKILPGCVFRASNPAIVGCEVLGGLVRAGAKVVKQDDENITGEIKQIQSEGKNVDEAKMGDNVAISLIGISVGRHVKEGDIFITDLTSEEYKTLKKYKDLLSESEKATLEEIRNIKQAKDKFWGV
ncbi:MAG: translation initiation factor IF-2 [Candidatus Aenigmatarchaeota archaeon]|nr:MAG: translation initiation factor IF-2 [Candidatus Aenigmarchaeota archaeon]